MYDPRTQTAGFAVTSRGPRARSLTTARSERRPQRVMPLTRKYEVAGLTPNGEIDEFARLAPATPVFEDAFGAFARGTLFQTTDGPVAVEDLWPGMSLVAADGGTVPLKWKGSMTLYPNVEEQGAEQPQMTRITADTFGLGRPMGDLLLGPRARLLFRHARCTELVGQPAAFAPARAFADGTHSFSVMPMSPVQVFHLAFDRQVVLRANGVEVESFHPGLAAERMMEPNTLSLFLSLFPHARSLHDFGAMPVPRLTAFELDGLRAA